MDSHSQIEDAAAEWLARRDGDHWSEDDEAGLQQWIAGSTARRVAYLRLKSTWDAAARLRVLRATAGSEKSAGADAPPAGAWRQSPFFEQPPASAEPLAHARPRRFPKSAPALAAAAALALCAIAGFGAYRFWDSLGDRYTTAVGGFASVPLVDGSKITLNTDSEIRVLLSEKERLVELQQGEAFFEVAKDSARPFVVRAGQERIIAVGTKFAVQHIGDAVRVLVTQGKVRVTGSDRDEALDHSAAAVLLTAGDMARADRSALIVQKAPLPRMAEILSWREGYLRFHETALADAVAEMNRYNTRKIVIEDPALASLKISGTFRPTQYEAFVRVLQEGFAVRAHSDRQTITLSSAP